MRCLDRQAGTTAVSLAWARANSFWKGCAEAMAILMRRTDRRPWAPILRSARRSVPQVASANRVWARPMRRKAQSRTTLRPHRRPPLLRRKLDFAVAVAEGG